MTRGIISGHALVIIERRPEGPILDDDRHGREKEMRRGRMPAGDGFDSVAVLGFMLASIWQTRGLNGTHMRNSALVAPVLLAG